MIHRLIILLLIVGCVFAREYIAIIDFEGIGVSNDEAKALTQRLTSEMIALEVYQVVERSEMKRLLDEQKFQYSGCVDTKCAVEIGKLIGAKFMVVSSISKVDNIYIIDARLINVESGEAYISGQYTSRESLSNVILNGIKSIAYQLCELEENIPRVSIINRIEDKNMNLGLGFGIADWGHSQGIYTAIAYKFLNYNNMYIKAATNIELTSPSDPAPISLMMYKNIYTIFQNLTVQLGLGYLYAHHTTRLGGKHHNEGFGCHVAIGNKIYSNSGNDISLFLNFDYSDDSILHLYMNLQLSR